jgi:hypothetical protein
MSVKHSELADFISSTLDDFPKQEFEVAWTNQDYEACRIYQKERYVIDGGDQITRKVMLSNTGHAHYRRYYDTDEPAVGDTLHTIRVPWTRLSTNYSWDDLEIIRNKNNAKRILDLMKVRRIDGLWSLADLIEERFWKTPTSETDDLYPYGVPYYIRPMPTTTTTDGFVGNNIYFQDGTNSTTCAGINSNTESKWRNYAALYTEIDNAMLKKFRLGFMYTRFKAPLFINDPSSVRNAQKRIYCDFESAADLMDLADAKDDNHKGKDVLSNLTVDKGGDLVRINRLPVVPIPQLEGYTDPGTGTAIAPIWCIDFSYFVPVVHEGYWMEEGEPLVDRGQHTTFTVFLDGAHCNLCTNVRKAGFVLHKAY